ncbi:hypothetical protein AK830_g5723 [Neonectria ditissima]|uniref:Uncharacterized protein n=1 Tax=Neonectria ditissima TaxID=78410 RepID=A0A0P7BII4_9HYPO|nr:hypothetical protein AK830_g5723 [Neonectria ditissima]
MRAGGWPPPSSTTPTSAMRTQPTAYWWLRMMPRKCAQRANTRAVAVAQPPRLRLLVPFANVDAAPKTCAKLDPSALAQVNGPFPHPVHPSITALLGLSP